jgi:basic membrane protein A
MSESSNPEKIGRRSFVKYAAGAVGAVALAGAAYYLGTQGAAPLQPATTTLVETTTQAPLTSAAAVSKVHMLLYGHKDEGSWDPQLYETLMAAILKSPHDFHATVSEGVGEEAAETTMELAAKDNDLVIASTISYEGAVKSVAPRFPNVHFVLEQDPIGSDPKSLVSPTDYPANVIMLGPGCMKNNYVIGALAAKLVGPKAKLGFIQSLDVPVTVHTGAEMRLGAQSVYPNMEVMRDIIGDYVSPIKNRDAISFMADQGVKAVYVEQDDTSGILEAVEKGIYVIPAYRDLRPMAPDNVLCSSVWNWEAGFLDILNAHAEGRWDSFRSKNWYWEMTLANGGLSLGTFGNMVTDDLKAFADKTTSDINSGAISVPYVDTW